MRTEAVSEVPGFNKSCFGNKPCCQSRREVLYLYLGKHIFHICPIRDRYTSFVSEICVRDEIAGIQNCLKHFRKFMLLKSKSKEQEFSAGSLL